MGHYHGRTGYYDDKEHPVRTSKARPKLDAPITVLEFTTKVLGKPASEKRNQRRRLEKYHALDMKAGRGGWLTRPGGKGPYLVLVSEYGRLHPKELAGGQEESLEDRVQRLERQIAEIRPLRERVKSLEVQAEHLSKAYDALVEPLRAWCRVHMPGFVEASGEETKPSK